MSAQAAFTRTWRVGRYRATLSCPRPRPGARAAACVEWEPEIPQRLTKSELEAYRDGRDAAVRDMAAELHVTVAVLEL